MSGNIEFAQRQQDLMDDAAHLPTLTEESLSDLIKERHAFGAKGAPQSMYTYAGEVIVAVNPYAPRAEMAVLYSEETIKKYRNEAASLRSGGLHERKCPPHIFAVAAKAFQSLVTDKVSQNIVINGESGAGKTETTKYLCTYLIFATGGSAGNRRPSITGSTGDDTGGEVQQTLLHSSPVLECFGNAKTLRNDNSSRFGKYVRLLLSSDSGRMRLAGATVEKYLLEKSRVVSHSMGERTFHSMYALALGAPPELAAKLSLGEAGQGFSYLMPHGGSAVMATAVECTSMFIEVHTALQELLMSAGLPTARADFYWQVLAGVLHLGQVRFGERGTLADDASRAALSNVAKLWGLAQELHEDLKRALLVDVRSFNGVARTTRRDAAQAKAQADALAKEVYDRLFTALVHDVGLALGQPPEAESARFIGLLDIFGFEIFDGGRNRLEQLMINYANDKLQHYFAETAIRTLRRVYESEIPWMLRDYGLLPSEHAVDAALELVEGDHAGGPTNVLDRLNDGTKLRKKAESGLDESERAAHPDLDNLDMALFQQLSEDFTGTTTSASSTARRAFVTKMGGVWNGHEMSRMTTKQGSTALALNQLKSAHNQFAIQHFGALVPYNLTGWVGANFDRLDEKLTAPLSAASAATHELFAGAHQPPPSLDRSITEKFRREVSRGFVDEFGRTIRQSLLESLQMGTGHFIRCIKPNALKAKWRFDDAPVREQLQACGVLEAARISRIGYPHRMTLVDWLDENADAGLLATSQSVPPLVRRTRSAHERQCDLARQPARSLAARPFPFGFGLRELTEANDIISLSTVKQRASDGTWIFEERQHTTHVAEGATEMPAHDFVVGHSMIFFGPGAKQRIHLKRQLLTKHRRDVVRLQAFARRYLACKAAAAERRRDTSERVKRERIQRFDEATQARKENEVARRVGEIREELELQHAATIERLHAEGTRAKQEIISKLRFRHIASMCQINEAHEEEVGRLNDEVARLQAIVHERNAERDHLDAQLQGAEAALSSLTPTKAQVALTKRRSTDYVKKLKLGHAANLNSAIEAAHADAAQAQAQAAEAMKQAAAETNELTANSAAETQIDAERGVMVRKWAYGRRGAPHPRHVRCIERRLEWGKPGTGKYPKSISLDEVSLIDRRPSPEVARRLGSRADSAFMLSIIGIRRSLDIEFKTADERDAWWETLTRWSETQGWGMRRTSSLVNPSLLAAMSAVSSTDLMPE